MKRKQLGVALMMVLPVKAALGVLLQVKPEPMPTIMMVIVFVIGLIIYLRSNDTTD